MSRVRVWWVAVLLVGLIVSGCVQVPTTGPVVPGGTPGPAETDNVEIAPEPPIAGAEPATIVEGFLHAMATYRGGYDVARQYLTDDARTKWRPDDGVQVYADGYPIVEAANTVTLRAPKVGTVSADGAYRSSSSTVNIDFGLEQVDGEWRINNPPPGLLIPEYLFKRFYQRVDLFFFDPGHQTLVPDPIYLPTGNQTATTVLRRLLAGPTEWLSPVVVSGLPQGTELNVAAPVDEAGVVEISLSDAIAGLDEDGRSRMAAQIVWTLRQLSSNVTGVRILHNGAAFAVREQNQDGVVPIHAYDDLDPMPRALKGDLYASDDLGVARVTEVDGKIQIQPVAGPMGASGPIDSLAVSVVADQVAVVHEDRTSLTRAQLSDDEPVQLLSGAQNLGRPQFTRFNELWVHGEVDGGQQLMMFTADRQQVVDVGQVGTILRAQVSPDGLRLAVVRVGPKGDHELVLGRITRSDRVRVDGWQVIPFTAAQSDVRMPDVGWTSSTNLMLLVAEGQEAPAKPYSLDQSGSTWQLVGQPDNWNAVSLATSPRRQDPRVAMRASDNTVWRYEGEFRWPRLAEGLSTIAYPG